MKVTFQKQRKMIKDAHDSGAECVKFQCHVIDDEMIKNDVIPGNADRINLGYYQTMFFI